MSTNEFNFQISTSQQKVLRDKKIALSILWRVWIVRRPTADVVIEIYGNHIFSDKKLGIRIWTTLLISCPVAYDWSQHWCCSNRKFCFCPFCESQISATKLSTMMLIVHTLFETFFYFRFIYSYILWFFCFW